MNRSETINELAAALSKAQGEFESAKKDRANPFFKSKYADLASVLDATREAMAKNGLSFSQVPTRGDGDKITLTTMIMHSSGQWISGDYPVIVTKMDAQGLGSGITYARRYALQAMLGVSADDDDGEAAVGRVSKSASVTGAPVNKKPEWTKEQSEEAGFIRAEIIELGGEQRFKTLWEKMKYDQPSDTIDAMTALVSELRGMKE